MKFLSVKKKASKNVDVEKKVEPYISAFNEVVAEDLKKLRIQREKAVEWRFTTKSSLISYYKSLCVVENRFPPFNRTGIFTWSKAYKGESKEATEKTIQVEKASVLFNLAASYSVNGSSKIKPKDLSDDVTGSNAFNYSANVVSYMKKNGFTRQGSTNVDLSTECISMLEKLMLAQAQESVLAEGVGVKNPGASKQVGLYYHEVLTALNSPHLINNFDQTFKTYVQKKVDAFPCDQNTADPLSLVTVDTSMVETLLDASKESIFASAVPAEEEVVDERMGKARNKMIDEAATAKDKDLKRDSESLELPEAKRQKHDDSFYMNLAQKLREDVSSGKTAGEIMNERGMKAPLFNENLARMHTLLEGHRVAGEKNLDEFKQELNNLCEAYDSKNHTTAKSLISRLWEHVTCLRVVQDKKIVEDLDTVFKDMSKFNESLVMDAAFEGKESPLSLFSTNQLTNLQEIFGFLLKMKTGTTEYKKEDMTRMSFNEIVALLELTYANDDFRGCESLLGGLVRPVMRLQFNL